MQNKGLEETLIVTWFEGFWDFGEEKLGNEHGCILYQCKSIRLTATFPLFACMAAQWEGTCYIRK